MPIDKTIYDVGYVLGWSKKTSYKRDAINYYNIHFRFLQDHGLTKRSILLGSDLPDENTVIRESDLTEEGIRFAGIAEMTWGAAVERGTPPEDTSILERELANLRAQFKSC